jgi:hypothetical protein
MNGGLLLVDDGMVHDVTIGANTLISLASPTDLEGTILINQGSNATDMISFDTPLTRVKYDGETLTVTYGDNQTASYTLKSSSTSYALSVTEIPDPDGGTTLNLRTEATGIGQTPAGVHQHHPDLGVVGVVLHHLFDAHHHWSFAWSQRACRESPPTAGCGCGAIPPRTRQAKIAPKPAAFVFIHFEDREPDAPSRADQLAAFKAEHSIAPSELIHEVIVTFV